MRIKAVYPGTFDPVHFGHLNLMERAAAIFDELVVAVYDHQVPTKSLLFSTQERIALIEGALDSATNISVQPFGGLVVEFAREINAQVIVRGLRVFSDFEFEFRFALANQRLAPEIEIVNFITREHHTFLSGTTVREIASFGGDVSSMVPPNVARALHQHLLVDNDEFDQSVTLRD